MSTKTTENNTKTGWDKRAWRLAMIFALIVGLLEGPEFFNTLQSWINPALASNLAAVSLSLALLVFPPILSGIARRRTLLWAYPPLLAFIVFGIVWNALPQPPDPGGDGPDLSVSDTVALVSFLILSPMITAGPVCLFRYFRRRANAQKLANAAAMDQAIHTSREGVWPPPPSDAGTPQ